MKISGKNLKYEGMRLDKFLALTLEGISRAQIQRMIKEASVMVNDCKCKSSYILKKNDLIVVKDGPKKDSTIKHEKMNMEILFESDDFLVLDKPAGMVVHPVNSARLFSGTVVNQILNKIDSDVAWPDELRPGIVHRLDKDTSGALIIARNLGSYDHAIDLFKKRLVKKRYLALVSGEVKPREGLIDSPIGRDVFSRKKMAISSNISAKSAVSKYKIRQLYEINGKKFSLLEIDLITGRTHQIRVHLKAIGFPIVGDRVYGNSSVNKIFKDEFGLVRPFLHAYKLEFKDIQGKTIKTKSKLAMELDAVLKGMNKISF